MEPDIGPRLKAVRENQGMSQRELAKRTGVSNATISLIEQNRTSPSVGLLKKVLDGIPISLADFFALGGLISGGSRVTPSVDLPLMPATTVQPSSRAGRSLAGSLRS